MAHGQFPIVRGTLHLEFCFPALEIARIGKIQGLDGTENGKSVKGILLHK